MDISRIGDILRSYLAGAVLDKGPDYRFRTQLNSVPLVWDDEECFAGRFELYKTQNMYNFILLDTFDGRTWQVQWSTEAEDRMILSIY